VIEPAPERAPDAAGSGPGAEPRFHVAEYEGHRALWTDGVIFSVALAPGEEPFGYWKAMLPVAAPRSALLLGLGAGTLAHLLTRRAPGVQIVGVDNDAELVEFATREFGLGLPNLEVVIADAFDYTSRCTRRFDYIAVDVFAGRTFQRAVLRRAFLRRLRGLAASGGEIAINMFRERRSDRDVARIGRVLSLRRVDRLPCNLVIHCGPETPDRAPRPA
jgi:SAM-dependent methyltransferase